MNTTAKLGIVGIFALGTVAGGALLAHAGARPSFGEPFSGISGAALQLTPTQQAEWDRLSDQRATRHEGLALQIQRVRAILDEELLRPEPDLARVAAEMERTVDHTLALARTERDEALTLYADLSPAQKQRLAAEILARLERLDRARTMLQRLLGAPGPTT